MLRLLGSLSMSSSASNIILTPSGSITATNVQDGMEQLDTLKLPTDNYFGGNKNKLINPTFVINQRAYVSGNATNAGNYTLDRWKVTSTQGISFTAQTPADNYVTIPTGQTMQQIVEGVNIFGPTSNYVLSWVGTSQGRVNSGTYGNSPLTVMLPVGVNATVEFNAGTVYQPQLELGNIATPYECRFRHYEKMLCLRYYEIIGTVVWAVVTSGYPTTHWLVEKAVSPVLNYNFDSGTGATYAVYGRFPTNCFYQNAAHSQIASAIITGSAEL